MSVYFISCEVRNIEIKFSGYALNIITTLVINQEWTCLNYLKKCGSK